MMFEGFSKEDFDAYLPEKWSSNMFTLPRRKVKDKLDFVGRRLTQDFEAAGLVLTLHLSDDHPSLWNNKKVDTQWLFFSRDLAAQKELSEIIDTERTLAATLADPTPLYRHIFLGVSLNSDYLEIGIRLHYDAWVDRKNLLALCADTEKQHAFIELCQNLGGGFEIGLTDGARIPTGDVNQDTLNGSIEAFTDAKGWLFIGKRVSCDDATPAAGAILDSICEVMNSLIPVYRFISWSPSNDAVSMANIVAEKKEKREATSAELEQERQQREELRRQQAELRQKHREEVAQKVLDDQEWRARERAIRRAAAKAAANREESDVGGVKVEDGNVNVEPQETGNGVAASELSQRATRPKYDKERRPNDSRRERRERSKPTDETRRPSSDKSKGAERSKKFEGYRSKKGRPLPKAKGQLKTAPRLAKVSDERCADIQIGDNVTVLVGFLKDRIGVVQNIDEKGDLKVTFGSLTSRVSKNDVKGLGPSA